MLFNLKFTSYTSYGLNYYTFSHGGKNYRYTYDGAYNLQDNGSQVTYEFPNEGLYSMTDDRPIYLHYKKSYYQGYPQLLSKGVYVPSTENWYDDGMFNVDDYRIVAQYKYYYGWDANISASSFTPKNGTTVWLPIISSNKTTTTSNIAFDKAHTSFWFAIPSAVADHAKTKTGSGDFDVLYHTSIGDADLNSTSAVKEEVTKNIKVGNTTHSYKVIKIDFKKKISGAASNYVKFTIKKK